MMRRYVESALLIFGSVLLCKAGWQFVRYQAFEHHPEWFLAAPANSSPALPPLLVRFTSPSTLSKLASVHVLGKLDVPRLRLSVLILEGDDENTLGLAAGHVPGTAAIGSRGNAVLAGHRDSAFRPLRQIRTGDRIHVRTDRAYEYVVSSVSIVKPADTSVMNPTSAPTLTMITCFPFRFLGDAPKRYIVRARLAGA